MRSARRLRRTDRTWPARWRISSRRSSTSKTLSRSSDLTAGCCFANPAMRALVPSASVGVSLDSLVAADHPLRRMAEDTLATRQSRGPTSATFAEPKGGVGRAAAACPPRERCRGRAGRRHGDRAQRRVSEPGRVHDPVFAQAGGARPPVGGCCARSEESAQRDDDPPRTAAAVRGAVGAGLRQRRAAAARLASSRRPLALRPQKRCSMLTSSPARFAVWTKLSRASSSSRGPKT